MAIQRPGYAQAVQRMELGGKTRHQPGLVRLQVPDDRPAKIGLILHGLPFVVCLLHLVFAEHATTRRAGQAQSGFGLGLADPQEAQG